MVSTAAVVPGVAEGGAKTAVSSARGSGSTVVFNAGVTYVSVPVSVTDGEGRPIVDLDPSLFRVYENETPQVIDRIVRPGAPFNVALLIDTSSSMRLKVDETETATLAAVSAFGRLDAPMMVSFHRRVVWHSTVPDDRGRDRAGITQSTVGRTATRLYDALDLVPHRPVEGDLGSDRVGHFD